MSLQAEALLVIAALNGVLSYIILRGKKDSLNVSYFSVVFSVALWALFLALFLIEKNTALSVYFSVVYYLAAAAIPAFFLIFSLALTGKLNDRLLVVFLLPLVVLVIVFVLNSSFLVKEIVVDVSGGKNVVLNKGAYLFYSGYFIFYVLSSYVVLVRGYKSVMELFKKKQIMLIIAGTSVSYAFGMIFNLIIPYFDNYQLIWVGPLFTIFMVGAIAYAIFKHQLFSISLVIVEITLILINFFLLLNIIFSKDNISAIINIILFASVVSLSILLMRGIYKDIRDRERIEGLVKDMEVANERLKMMEEQKTEFVSIASHQLRTPLTVIKGYASMILEGTFGAITADVRGVMENLYKSSEKIVALVEDLLTVSRIEQGRMMLVFEKIDFSEFIKKLLLETEEEVKVAKINLSFTAEEGKDFFVSIDAKKFKQAVLHILDNAIKYTRENGSVLVNVDGDSLSNKVRLTISDTGAGMEKEQIAAIFERFSLKVNADVKDGGFNHTTDVVGKTAGVVEEGAESSVMNKRTPGIGLYIAQEIIEAHHGTIHVESAGVGKGTTVVVELVRAEGGSI